MTRDLIVGLLFLGAILIVGVIAILIGSAVYSYRKADQKSVLNSSAPIEDNGGRGAGSNGFINYDARKEKEE